MLSQQYTKALNINFKFIKKYIYINKRYIYKNQIFRYFKTSNVQVKYKNK